MPDDFNRSATTTDATYSTEQIESAYNVKWICYPILLILGTVGNLLNMLILSGMKSRNSTNVYLVFVATADLVVLSFHLPQHIHDSDESYVYTLSTEAQAKYEVPFRQFEGIQRWGQETAIQLSDWTLLIFSCERLLTSLRPFYFRERCSVNTAIVRECVLLFLCMLFNLYGPVQSYYCLGTPEYASNPTVCIQNTEWLANWDRVEERATIVVVIFKFVAMIALNSALACTLYHSWHSTASLKNGAPFHGPEPYVKSNRILGASTLLYLAAQLPSLVMKIIMYSHDHYGGATLSDSTQQFATPFVQMTFLANYALNFYIYFSVSKRFREEVRSIRRRFARKSPRQSPKSSVGDLPLRVMVAGSSQLTLVSQSSVCETLDMVMSPTPTLAPIPEIEIESDVESEQDEKGPPPPRGRSGPRFSIGNIELQR